jgi:SAM-dependent methyltransferase
VDPIAAYDGKASDFAFRLPYADEAFDAIAGVAQIGRGSCIADIASGTGHVSEAFLDRADRVYAVEPNAAMRREAERRLGSKAGFTSVAGTAEETTLPDASVDLVTVGQAWHWFDRAAAALEFRRILKPDGWVALLWNRLGDEPPTDLRELFDEGEYEFLSFPRISSETWETYIRGVRSAAPAPAVGSPDYARFERQHRARFARGAAGGRLRIQYETQIAVGQPFREA